MKWNRLKNRIRSKPELIDPYRVMSYRAAKKTWKIQGRPDTWDFMEGARIKAAKTPSEWEALTGISRKQYVSSVNASRRLAIALIVVILMASFMACTVPGRALAKAIYETFTTFVGNMLYISTEQDMEAPIPVPVEGSTNSIRNFNSLEEASQQLTQPLLYFHNGKYIWQNTSIEETEVNGKSISTEYLLDNILIKITQQWLPEGYPVDTDILLDNAEYFSINIDLGIQIYGAYTEQDHSYYGSTIMDPCIIHIGIMNIPEKESISDILNDLSVYSR